MPTRQGSRLAKKLNTSLRLSCLRSTTFPCSSTPCTCNSDFAKSTPIVVIFIRALLSFSVDECISTLAPRCRLVKGASIPLLAAQQDGFNPEQIGAPEAVLEVANECQPGRAIGPRCRPKVFRKYAAHDIFVDLDAKGVSDLLGDAHATE